MGRAKSSKRSYSDRTLKLLWGRAAGRCAFPECRVEIYEDPNDNYDPIVPIGEIAHVEACSDAGPRANSNLTAEQKDDYDNLILLCGICHPRVDGRRHEFTVEKLKQIKADHEAWVRASLPERGRSTTGWIPVLLEGEHAIDDAACRDALLPDFCTCDSIRIAGQPGSSWMQVATQVAGAVRVLLASNDQFEQRFAVFPLAPLTSCFVLGYKLTNRPNVRLFQYQRDDRAWQWPSHPGPLVLADAVGMPDSPDSTADAVAICFQLSGMITDDHLRPYLADGSPRVDFLVSGPGTSWLKSPNQLDALGTLARETYERLPLVFPNASTWHIFFAGPAPGAVMIGQQLNPTTSPNVQLYEFNRKSSPAYTPSLMLGASL